MKKVFVAAVFLLLIFGLGFLFTRFFGPKSIHKVIVGNSSVVVETADTPEKTQQGLSDREKLCSDCGMLFIFDQPGIYPFWMRKMRFDIDIIWIAGDRVVDITYSAKVPPTEELEAPRTFYQSKELVNKVLEVNVGWAKKNNVVIGDLVKF